MTAREFYESELCYGILNLYLDEDYLCNDDNWVEINGDKAVIKSPFDDKEIHLEYGNWVCDDEGAWLNVSPDEDTQPGWVAF